MENYLSIFKEAFLDTFDWTIKSILFEVHWYTNYFWGLIGISLIVWILEIVFPWRKEQSVLRRDFWLDAFYMFFNFFIFAIVISGVYKMIEVLFLDIGITAKSLALIDISEWPKWVQLLVFFVVIDFVQWFTHVLYTDTNSCGIFIKSIIRSRKWDLLPISDIIGWKTYYTSP